MATSRGGPAASSDLVVLPSYPQMIVEAIASLREDNGSSQAAIARRIEAAHGAGGELPPSHPALVAAHLSRMAAAAELVAVAGGKYALPTPPSRCPVVEEAEEVDDEAEYDDDSPDDAPPPLPPLPPQPPAKRGRGRPPKVRPPGFPVGAPGAPIGATTNINGLSVPAAAPAAPRRRGRPPKPRDPLAPPKVARPRGRPRKNPLPDGMVQIPRPGSTAAKPRAQFAEVGFV
ncbi:hypothetical protein ACQ4PT_043081 [Festuca glaucescens]